jgi:hypothetical protein
MCILDTSLGESNVGAGLKDAKVDETLIDCSLLIRRHTCRNTTYRYMRLELLYIAHCGLTAGRMVENQGCRHNFRLEVKIVVGNENVPNDRFDVLRYPR